RFTPSRMPLFDQRWFAPPSADAGVVVVDAGATFPRGAQTGIRWSHAGAGFETSVSLFNGFNHLPDIEPRLRPAFRPEIDLIRILGWQSRAPCGRTATADTRNSSTRRHGGSIGERRSVAR